LPSNVSHRRSTLLGSDEILTKTDYPEPVQRVSCLRDEFLDRTRILGRFVCSFVTRRDMS
ncbi:MAG: hypothetical protein ABGX22_10635, partial [Pirellulaceae bacterium]